MPDLWYLYVGEAVGKRRNRSKKLKTITIGITMNEIKTLPLQVTQSIVDLALADTALRKRHKAEQEAAHIVLWDAVHNQYPELDDDANYSLNCQFAEQGVVMLELREKERNLGAMLSRMIKDIN